MENKIIKSRLKALREVMKKSKIDYYLIPTSDCHNSEYVADYFQVRKYFSGFSGSNGTLVVGKSFAGLWTDGRYFLQAEKELKGTGVELFKMLEKDVPTIEEFLASHVKENEVLGFDGMTLNAAQAFEYGKALENRKKSGASKSASGSKAAPKVNFASDRDLAESIWKDRPMLPCGAAYVLQGSLTGETYASKLSRVREKLADLNAKAFFLGRLDDIMWLTNLRGSDIERNPVALSYFLIDGGKTFLFIQDGALSEKVRAYCAENGITIKNYHDTVKFLRSYKPSSDIVLDPKNVSYTVYRILENAAKKSGHRLIDAPNPTTDMKAVKNRTELKNIRETYLADSAILTKFIYWVKKNAGKTPLTEIDISDKLDGMRRISPGFIDLSFDTICGYAENAAIVHYKAKKETAASVGRKGMLLIDSGGTYMGGTTDVTRTIVLGKISAAMKKHFTLVACAMLRLKEARFPKGVTGPLLDGICREVLWKNGLDYNHGTGHGVGYMLNVHEGPASISWRGGKNINTVPLEAGMLISDEPGVYISGSHGIRTENILEVLNDGAAYGINFLKFAFLTYAPIDLEAIDKKYMTPQDVENLNAYHADVYKKISPRIKEPEILEWLKKATAAI